MRFKIQRNHPVFPMILTKDGKYWLKLDSMDEEANLELVARLNQGEALAQLKEHGFVANAQPDCIGTTRALTPVELAKAANSFCF